MSIFVSTGDKIPLFVAVEDEVASYVIRAQIIRRAPYAVLHSDVALSYIASSPGHYQNSSITMPSTDFIDVIYEIYQTDGITLVAKASESFQPAIDAGGATVYSQVVAGVITSDSAITGTVAIYD